MCETETVTPALQGNIETLGKSLGDFSLLIHSFASEVPPEHLLWVSEVVETLL